MVALTKADVAKDITEQLGFNTREAKELVDLFFEEISQILEEGTEVRLSGLGKFSLRDKKARPGRNPKTGQEVRIDPRRVVLFHAGTSLSENIKKIED